MSDLINRQDAIDALKLFGAEHNAIAVIKGLPSAEPCDNCIHDDEDWDSEACDGCVSGTERKVAHIQDFTQYQIDWLTAHCDLELEPELESWVICFLKDTADCYDKEYLTSVERTGYWIVDTKTLSIMLQEPRCSVCGDLAIGVPGFGRIPTNFCPNCGAKMNGVKIRGEEE